MRSYVPVTDLTTGKEFDERRPKNADDEFQLADILLDSENQVLSMKQK